MLRLFLVLLRLQLAVTGWDLLSTLRDQAASHQYYESQPPQACPRCGEPMRQGPPEAATELFCLFDGFAYPQDWDPSSMNGM